MADALGGAGLAVAAALAVAVQGLAVGLGSETRSVSAVVAAVFLVNLALLVPAVAVVVLGEPPERVRRFIEESETIGSEERYREFGPIRVSAGNDRRYVERRIEPGDRVSAFGVAEARRRGPTDGVIERGDPFVISDAGKRRSLRRYRGGARGLLAVAALSIAVGLTVAALSLWARSARRDATAARHGATPRRRRDGGGVPAARRHLGGVRRDAVRRAPGQPLRPRLHSGHSRTTAPSS